MRQCSESLRSIALQKKNKTWENYQFHMGSEKEEKSFGEFENDFKLLSQTFNFGELTDSIRDQIVIDIRAMKLRKRLLEVPDLKLEKANSMYKAAAIIQARVKSLDSKARCSVFDGIMNPLRKEQRQKRNFKGRPENAIKESFRRAA